MCITDVDTVPHLFYIERYSCYHVRSGCELCIQSTTLHLRPLLESAHSLLVSIRSSPDDNQWPTSAGKKV